MTTHSVIARYRAAKLNKWASVPVMKGSFKACTKRAEHLADNCTNKYGWIIEVSNEVGKVVWCETFFGDGAEYPLQSNRPE